MLGGPAAAPLGENHTGQVITDRKCCRNGGRWPADQAAQPVTTWVTLVESGDGRFRHKGLKLFFATAAKTGIQAKHADRLRLILGRLNVSTSERDMDLPGLDLHELRGARKGKWAVKVSGNWRVTFTWTGRDVDRVDYEDYH